MPQAFGFALGFLVPGAGVAFGSLAGFAGGAAFSGTITGMLLRTVALTVLQSAFTKKPTNPGVRSSVTLAGDTTPEATGVGLFVTAGRRTYPPKSIPNGTKPNVFTVNRIELSGMPGIALLRVLVGGEDAEVDWQATPHADFGQPFGGRFIDDGKVHGWVKFYDGHQTAADPMLVAKLGADPDHPYTAAMIGTGIAYAVVTLKWNPNVFRGDEWNSLQFECEGLPLYDPRSDSSVGGVGAQRWADPATWVTTRNPKVIEYNVRRGLVPAPGKVWGFRATESDLPLANWMAQMNACDEQVNIGGGLGPRYRCGFEFSFTEEPRAVTGRLNDACSGRVADMGGRWVGRAGPPGPAVATIVEGAGQLLVSEPGALDLFDGTETVVNALSAVFPDPASGWRERETPLFTKTEWVAEDGRVRQARLDLPAVPFPGRAQILAKEMVEDNRRQRRYVLPARAELAEVDLLETYALTILGDGFDAKDMELTGLVIDPATAAVQVAGREVNPADWTPPTVDTVFTAPVPVVRQDLPAQTVPGFDLRAATVTSGGQSRPGVEIVWTTSDDLRDWRGIVFEVRLAATGAVVARDTITDLKTGVYPVQHPATQFAATTYEARVQPYAPGVPVAWSTWRPATTPDIRLATADLADPVQVGVATASPAAQAAFSALEQMAAAREVSERIEGLVADALGTAQQALSEARIDLRAGIREGGAADPAFARWHGAVPADWTSSTDISGWAEPFRGRYGTGLALDIPAGSGTVDLVTPLDVDPAAEWLRIDLLVSYVAGDPAGVTLAVEYSADGGQTWTGAAALRGDPAADTFADLQLLPGAAIMEASIPARRPAGTWNAVRLRLRASTAGVPDAQSLRLHWLDVAVAGDTDERAAPGGPIDAAQAAADDALADAAAAFDRALRAPIGGWSADPTGARWSAPGVLDAAYWATEDAAGVLTQDTGAPSGSAIRFDIPSGGRSTAVLPVLPGADPAAEWVVIVATVVFDAGDPLAQRFRAEWWDGAGWVNGDMLGAAAPNGDFATHGIAVAPGRIQIREVLVRRPATADGSTPPRLRFNAAVPGITSAQTLTLHRLDMRPATEAEIEAGPGGSWKVETDRLEIEKVTPTGAVNAVEDAIQASGGGSLANVTQRAIASVDSADVDVAISGALDAFASEVGGGGSALALENYLTSADTDFAIATSAQELSASLGVATYRPISQLLGEARWSVSPVGAISGLPSLPASGWTVSASGFLERAIPQTGNGTYVYLKQITEVAEGDTVEVTWLAQTTGTGLGGTGGAATRVYWLDETFQQVGSFAAGLQDLSANNQPQQRSFTAVAPAGARYARAGFLAGWDAYGADGGVFTLGVRLSNFRVENVTAQTAVEAWITTTGSTHVDDDGAVAAVETVIGAEGGGSLANITQKAVASVDAAGAVSAVEDVISAEGGGSLANVTQKAVASVSAAGAVSVLNDEVSTATGGLLTSVSSLALVASDLDGNAGSAIVMRAGAAGLELTDWTGTPTTLRLAADQLIVSDGTLNLIPNGDFRHGDLRGWSPGASPYSVVAADSGISGALDTAPAPWVLMVTPQASFVTQTIATNIGVAAGQRFFFSFDYGAGGNQPINASGQVLFRWYDRAGTLLSTGSPESPLHTSVGWAPRFSGTETAPTGAVRLDIQFRRRLNPNDGTAFFANLRVIRQETGATIITPQGITASEVAANTLGAGEINTASLGAVNAWVGTLTVGDTAITESDQEDFGSVTLTIGGTTSAIFTQTVDIDGPTTRADVRLSFAMGAFSGSPTWTVTIESPTGTVRKSVSGNTKQEFMTVPSEITLASGPRNLTYRFSITGATGSVTFNARQGFVGQFKR